MGLFRRKKKKPDYLEELIEAPVPVPAQVQEEKKGTQHIALEYCEQIMAAAKELEETKREYKIVTDYLTDIQVLEELPEQEMQKLQETAKNVQSLNDSRDTFLKKKKTISDAQFGQMEQEEEDIPDAIKRLKANEAYQSAVKRDMQYLEGEKSEWHYYQESLEEEQKILRRILYGIVGVFAVALVVLVVLYQVINLKIQPALFAAVLIAGGAGGVTFWRIQNDQMEMKKSQLNINRAITLLNRVKLKYVNITNAVDYACEKYHVKNSNELNYVWEQYLEAVKEKEKYQRTNEDLEYFNGKLVRDLHSYRLYDSRIWVHQTDALLDKKEMVEVKHSLLVRRQKLRTRMEYQVSIIRGAKEEIGKIMKNYRQHQNEIQDILESLDRMCGEI